MVPEPQAEADAVTTRERFQAVMRFRPFDRLPILEWAGWWDKTMDRWYGEGLPAELQDRGEIRDYLGLDCYRQLWIPACAPGCPEPASVGAGLIRDRADYHALKPYLYPAEPIDVEMLEGWAKHQQRGEMVVWMTLDGFFWYPRVLLGIERHLYAFHDQAELMHEINSDLVEFNLRVLDQFCRICTPQFATIAEDMSYNHGPMISEGAFETLLMPYYRQIVPELKRRGIVPMVDSDGDVTTVIRWLEAVGIEGLLPLERMAGVDVAKIRRDHPTFKMIGAFDKTVMHLGDDAVRAEFERLLPVMKQGGFIASVDHQTPPAVSLDQYRRYVELLREYCQKAAQ